MKKLIKLLSDLAAFNQLNDRIVKIISDVYEVDAAKICRDNGITYFVGKDIDVMSKNNIL